MQPAAGPRWAHNHVLVQWMDTPLAAHASGMLAAGARWGAVVQQQEQEEQQQQQGEQMGGAAASGL
jgi:hypothetical protein